jgi:hypothetical protein
MRIKVSDSDVLALEQNQKKLLFIISLAQIFVIDSFRIEEVEEIQKIKKGLFKPTNSVPVKQKYLVDIVINTYHKEGKFLGTLSDKAVEQFICRDFYVLRSNWIALKEMIKAFGFDVVPTSDTTLLERAFEAGREYQEYKGNANLEEKSWELTFSKWCEKNNIKNL